MNAPNLEQHCGSWVVVNRASGTALLETFHKPLADSYANDGLARFEVLTAAQWLGRINRNGGLNV